MRNIGILTPGGIEWEREFSIEMRNFARHLFMCQFGAFLELYYPDWNLRVRDMQIAYPQHYECICPFCGNPVLFDFWGLMIRSTDKNSVRIMEHHTCDRESPNFRWGSQFYSTYVPNSVMRDASNAFAYRQKLVFRATVHFAAAIHAEIFFNGVWPYDEMLRPIWPRPEVWQEPIRYELRRTAYNTMLLRLSPLFHLPDAEQRNEGLARQWAARQRQWFQAPPWRATGTRFRPIDANAESRELNHRT